MQLFHADFLASLTFVDLLYYVPQDLDLFFFSLQLFLHLPRLTLCTLRIKHHHLHFLETARSNPAKWRSFKAEITVLFFMTSLHRHVQLTFIDLLLQVNDLSLHLLIDLTPLLPLLLLLFYLPLIPLCLSALFDFGLLVLVSNQTFKFLHLKLLLLDNTLQFISLGLLLL